MEAPAKKGMPAWLKISMFAVMTVALGAAGIVGKFLWEKREADRITTEATKRLADKIVDVKVSPDALEREGYYKVKFGGSFLQGCRARVLKDPFNKALDNPAKAEKISHCIKGEIDKVEANARAQMSIRMRFGL